MADIYHPNIKGLCQDIRTLRESVLRRCAVITSVGTFDEASLPKAAAIVDGKIGDFLFDEEHRPIRDKLVDEHGGTDRWLTLLVLECAAAIGAALPGKPLRLPARGTAARRRPDLRLVLERGQ